MLACDHESLLLFQKRSFSQEKNRTLWCSKVDDVAVRLEHVDFLNGLDRLDIKLLECGLQLLVVRAGALVDLLNLSPRCALSTVHSLLAMSNELPFSPSCLQNRQCSVRARGLYV